MTIRQLASVLAGCLSVLAVSPAPAAVFWVDPVAGADTGSCGTPAAPCLTIQFAVDRSAPGDTVRAKPGTYHEVVSLAGKPTTLLADAYAVSGDRSATIIDCIGALCEEGTGDFRPPVYVGNGSTFTGFTVRNAGGTGIEGAGSVVITQNVVTGNSGLGTGWGGGISVYSTVVYLSTAPLRVENNEVYGNGVPLLGGGIFVRARSQADRPLRPVIVQNNNVHNNVTNLPSSRGGGIYVRLEGVNGGETNVTITQNTIQGNTNVAGADPIYYPWGGGIAAGAYGYGTHNLSVTSNIIDGNHATVGAGAALVTSLNPTATAVINFSGNTVRNNDAADPSGFYGFGGGVFAYAFGLGSETVTVENNQITGNTSRVFGGGMDVRASPGEDGTQSVTARNNVISGNETAEWGGGIFALLGLTDAPADAIASLEVLDNVVTSNSCSGLLPTLDPAGRGGGIFAISAFTRSVAPGATLVVRGNDVRSNRVNLVGGGLNLSVTSSSLGDPEAQPPIAAAPAAASLSLDHNLVAQNVAASPDIDTFPASGGGVFTYVSAEGQATSSLRLDFLTISENTTDIGAGGFEIESYTVADEEPVPNTGGAAVVVSNSIVSDNIGFGIGGPVPGDPGIITLGGTGNLTVDLFYNDAFANSDGNYESWLGDPTGLNGNISVDPSLATDFGLTTCSGVMDAADPAVDYSLETQPNRGRANLGHQGGTSDSAPSLADVNGDGIVDGIDVLRIATSFASTSADPSRYLPAADLDVDLIIDGNDLAYVAAGFGVACP